MALTHPHRSAATGSTDRLWRAVYCHVHAAGWATCAVQIAGHSQRRDRKGAPLEDSICSGYSPRGSDRRSPAEIRYRGAGKAGALRDVSACAAASCANYGPLLLIDAR
jgi:hypothetical protein